MVMLGAGSRPPPRRGGRAAVGLADLRAAGLVHRASDRVGEGVERTLPVAAALRPLLPGGVLRRGSTVSVQGTDGATSLMFALLAQASAAGSWCAAVGLPNLGLVAAAEAGIVLERFALVPAPGPEWAEVVATLLDGLDIVVATTPGPVPSRMASRLVARARQRGPVLITMGRWPGAEVTLEVTGSTWHGIGQGRGRLRCRELEVVAAGRGAAARAHRAHLWLPAETSAVTPAAPAAGPEFRPLRRVA